MHNTVLRNARQNMARDSTLAQFDVLAQLTREAGPIPLNELSRRLLVTAGNITGLIDRMEAQQLVKRVPDDKDRRITRIHLTPKGRKLAKRLIPRHTTDIDQLFSGMSPAEIETLRKLLDKLLVSLESREEQK